MLTNNIINMNSLIIDAARDKIFLTLIVSKNIYTCSHENSKINFEKMIILINDFLKNNKIKFPVLGKPIRFLLINSYQGPSISDIFVILGKKDTINRLNQYRGD